MCSSKSKIIDEEQKLGDGKQGIDKCWTKGCLSPLLSGYNMTLKIHVLSHLEHKRRPHTYVAIETLHTDWNKCFFELTC